MRALAASTTDKLRAGGCLWVRRVGDLVDAVLVDADGARYPDVPVTEVQTVLAAIGCHELAQQDGWRRFQLDPGPASWSAEAEAARRMAKGSEPERKSRGKAAQFEQERAFEGRTVTLPPVGDVVEYSSLKRDLGVLRLRLSTFAGVVATLASPGFLHVDEGFVGYLRACGAEVVFSTPPPEPMAGKPKQHPLRGRSITLVRDTSLKQGDLASGLGFTGGNLPHYVVTPCEERGVSEYVNPENPRRGRHYTCGDDLADILRGLGADVDLVGKPLAEVAERPEVRTADPVPSLVATEDAADEGATEVVAESSTAGGDGMAAAVSLRATTAQAIDLLLDARSLVSLIGPAATELGENGDTGQARGLSVLALVIEDKLLEARAIVERAR